MLWDFLGRIAVGGSISESGTDILESIPSRIYLEEVAALMNLRLYSMRSCGQVPIGYDGVDRYIFGVTVDEPTIARIKLRETKKRERYIYTA